ncbi:hypothetical protein TorRG33x02_219280 [Trema orientale]|uniref:Transmembrane protein n=1 Tax=Trema orientale TaxID=63057 RepID=A0A2P5E9T2_TREOI|nr:hypothetical protein TorRG33x02_219280 [Trema orientale]
MPTPFTCAHDVALLYRVEGDKLLKRARLDSASRFQVNSIVSSILFCILCFSMLLWLGPKLARPPQQSSPTFAARPPQDRRLHQSSLASIVSLDYRRRRRANFRSLKLYRHSHRLQGLLRRHSGSLQ